MKSYTDLEQSKKLVEFLPLESADMFWMKDSKDFYEVVAIPYSESGADKDDGLPCWSLTSLLSVFPKIQGGKPIIALDDNYITYPHIRDLHTKADNLVDACYEMILKLHELNLL